MVLRIHCEAILNLFLDFLLYVIDFLLYVIAFRVYPYRSRAEQSLLRFYRILIIKRAVYTYVYVFKKTKQTKTQKPKQSQPIKKSTKRK